MDEERRMELEEQVILKDLAGLFSTLGDTTRLRILSLIRDAETSVQDLSDTLKISNSAVSHQLRLLRSHHLVQSRKDGRNVFYSLYDQNVWDLLQAGESNMNRRVSREGVN